MTIEQWRAANGSTIANILSLARTSYLNLLDPVGKKKICQRILADIRATRPAPRGNYMFWLGADA